MIHLNHKVEVSHENLSSKSKYGRKEMEPGTYKILSRNVEHNQRWKIKVQIVGGRKLVFEGRPILVQVPNSTSPGCRLLLPPQDFWDRVNKAGEPRTLVFNLLDDQ